MTTWLGGGWADAFQLTRWSTRSFVPSLSLSLPGNATRSADPRIQSGIHSARSTNAIECWSSRESSRDVNLSRDLFPGGSSSLLLLQNFIFFPALTYSTTVSSPQNTITSLHIFFQVCTRWHRSNFLVHLTTAPVPDYGKSTSHPYIINAGSVKPGRLQTQHTACHSLLCTERYLTHQDTQRFGTGSLIFFDFNYTPLSLHTSWTSTWKTRRMLLQATCRLVRRRSWLLERPPTPRASRSGRLLHSHVHVHVSH